ncbi:tartrate-resistant acid phosphatase type 5-like [Clytia hemisphaerica]|uniref:Tartrate-resistant acid phosphatase type 5 n=1 Tax=Clytia hemisphaerica TaxID=252671 RepID=A0A7M5UH69_9CNID|eukprot:TCONS_00010308-protein
MKKQSKSFILLICTFIELTNAGNFLILGDWGGIPIRPYTTDIEESTANQMSVTATQKNSKFVIALGDNFYFTGVKNEYDHRFNETYNDVFNQPSLQVPWYVVAGNHDHYGNITGQLEYTKHSNIWTFPSLWYSKTFQFSDTSRTMKLIMIDTVVLCGNTDSDFDAMPPNGPEGWVLAEEQWAWLETELKASSDFDYLLVGGHFPVWSIAEHGPTSQLVERLKPLLEKYAVSAYINGHDHNLQHIKEDSSDVHYFTIGCANFIEDSKKHKDSIPKGSLQFYWAESSRKGGFAFVDVTDTEMSLTMIDSMGAPIHQQSIKPRNHSLKPIFP